MARFGRAFPLRAVFGRPVRAAAGQTAYTITPATGAYVLTGIGQAVTRSLKARPTVGAYVLTGIGQAVTRSLKASPTVGAYVLTGISQTVTRSLKASPTVGAYAVSGVGQTVKRAVKVVPQIGAYVVSGIAQVLALFSPNPKPHYVATVAVGLRYRASVTIASRFSAATLPRPRYRSSLVLPI